MGDVSFGKDKTIMKKKIVEGEGYDNPKDSANVTVKVYSATDDAGVQLPGSALPVKLEFVLGNGKVSDVIECAVGAMKKYERAVVTCTNPALCTGDALELKEGSAKTVVITLELVNFEKPKETWDMSEEEKLEFGLARKEVGTDLFKKGRFNLA